MRAFRTSPSRASSSALLACFAIFTVACGDDDGTGTDGGAGMDAGRDATAPMCSSTGPENTAEACNDGCDNDGDDFADCDDRDCCGARTDCPATTFCGRPRDGGMAMACDTIRDEDTLEACTNDCDDDGNGFADCNEFDCCSVRTDCPATTACGRPRDGGVTAMVSIEQIQNREDPAHPAPGTRVTVTDDDLVALTPRLLVGSANGGSARTCRFSVWVGKPVSGDFTAIAVQELISLPAGTTSCFALPPGRISPDFAPGDTVTSIANATYSEFCAGPTGANPSPCTSFEQSSIFLGGSAVLMRGAAGTAPEPTVVQVSDLVAAAGAPGPRAIALEGTLLRVEDVRIRRTMEGTFTRYSAYLPDAPTVELDIVISNFIRTSCARAALDALGAEGTVSLTGVLLPNFGRWSLRLRDENDIDPITCE